MSRNRALVLALVVVLVVAVLGARLAGSVGHWLMAVHGRH